MTEDDWEADEDEDGDEGREQRGRPDGDDLLAEGVRELGVDDLAVGEGDGEGAGWCRVGFVDLELGRQSLVFEKIIHPRSTWWHV